MLYSFRSRFRPAAAALLVAFAGACTPPPEPPPMPEPAPAPAATPEPAPPPPMPPAAPVAPATPAAVPAELSAAWNAYLAAWNQDDPMVVAALFTEDAVVVVDDSTYTGREAIRTRWIVPSLPMITTLEVTPETFAMQNGDIVETGRYTLTMMEEGETETETGDYTQTWTRGSDGSWRIRTATVD